MCTIACRHGSGALKGGPADDAIAAVDALAAEIFWWAFHHALQRVTSLADDNEYRRHLAIQSSEFRLLFETAKAVKHGRLTHGNPPSVRAADQLASKEASWDNVRWDSFRWDTPQVRIEPIGEKPWSAEFVVTRALEFLERQMATLGIP